MKRSLGAVIVVVIIVVGALYVAIPSLVSQPSPSACTGGTHNAKTSLIGADELGKQLYNLTYTQGGVEQSGLYYSFTSGALGWIKSTTAANATFFNWWDYGKEIVGCTGRASVIINPSAQFVALGFAKSTGQLDSSQSLLDVGTALFTTNATLSGSIVSKYGAGYVLVTTEDGGEKAPFILQLLGLNPTDYLATPGVTFDASQWTGLGQQTVIYRLLSGQGVTGFSQVYSDNYVKVFTVS